MVSSYADNEDPDYTANSDSDEGECDNEHFKYESHILKQKNKNKI